MERRRVMENKKKKKKKKERGKEITDKKRKRMEDGDAYGGTGLRTCAPKLNNADVRVVVYVTDNAPHKTNCNKNLQNQPEFIPRKPPVDIRSAKIIPNATPVQPIM
jgi:hypothetical protein